MKTIPEPGHLGCSNTREEVKVPPPHLTLILHIPLFLDCTYFEHCLPIRVANFSPAFASISKHWQVTILISLPCKTPPVYSGILS